MLGVAWGAAKPYPKLLIVSHIQPLIYPKLLRAYLKHHTLPNKLLIALHIQPLAYLKPLRAYPKHPTLPNKLLRAYPKLHLTA